MGGVLRNLFSPLEQTGARDEWCQGMNGVRTPSFRKQSLRSLRRLLRLFLQFLEQRIDGPVHCLAADVLVADDALVIEDIDGRPAMHVPCAGDGAGGAAAVPPGTPGNALLFHHLLESIPIPI